MVTNSCYNPPNPGPPQPKFLCILDNVGSFTNKTHFGLGGIRVELTQKVLKYRIQC